MRTALRAERWIGPTVGALFFGSLHVALVAVPVVSTWGTGEGQAFAVLFFDLPFCRSSVAKTSCFTDRSGPM